MSCTTPRDSTDWKYRIRERLHSFAETRKKTFFSLTMTFLIHPVTILSWFTTFKTTNMFLAYCVFLIVTESQTMSHCWTRLEESTATPDLASSGICIVSKGISPLWRMLARRCWLLLAENTKTFRKKNYHAWIQNHFNFCQIIFQFKECYKFWLYKTLLRHKIAKTSKLPQL